MTDIDWKARAAGWEKSSSFWRTMLEKAEAERDAIAKERDELGKALRFYRDAWEGHSGDSGPGGNTPADPEVWPSESLCEDGGEIARQALARLKEST